MSRNIQKSILKMDKYSKKSPTNILIKTQLEMGFCHLEIPSFKYFLKFLNLFIPLFSNNFPYFIFHFPQNQK